MHLECVVQFWNVLSCSLCSQMPKVTATTRLFIKAALVGAAAVTVATNPCKVTTVKPTVLIKNSPGAQVHLHASPPDNSVKSDRVHLSVPDPFSGCR